MTLHIYAYDQTANTINPLLAPPNTRPEKVVFLSKKSFDVSWTFAAYPNSQGKASSGQVDLTIGGTQYSQGWFAISRDGHAQNAVVTFRLSALNKSQQQVVDFDGLQAGNNLVGQGYDLDGRVIIQPPRQNSFTPVTVAFATGVAVGIAAAGVVAFVAWQVLGP